MKFRQTGTCSIEVILCQEEASTLGLKEEIDCTDPKVQSMLSHLLQKARKETGGPLERGDFLIEIYKEKEDTVLSFTPAEDTLSVPKEQQMEVCSFCGSEEMIQCSLRLYRGFQEKLKQSCLYLMNGNYYLTFVLPRKDKTKVRAIALEYASLADRQELAKGVLEEHARCLIRDHALQTLCRYFG